MALIAHTAKGSSDGNGVTTDPIDTTGAGWIAVSVSYFDSAEPPTDNFGNAYGPPPADFGALISLFASTETYICESPIVGPGHTFTSAPVAPGKKPSIAVAAFSGVGSPIDDAQHTSTTNTSVGYASITPPAADTLILLTLARNTASVATPSAGFIVLDEVDPTSDHVGLTHAYMVTPDTSVVTPEWTWPTSSADRGGGVGWFSFVESPVLHEDVFIVGEDGSVSSSRTVMFNLDGTPRTIHEPDTVFIGGNLIVTGDTTIELDMESMFSRLLVTEDGELVLDDDGNPLFTE